MYFICSFTLTCSDTATPDFVLRDVGALAEEHRVVRRLLAFLNLGDVCDSLALISEHIRGPSQGGRGNAALPGAAESEVGVVVGRQDGARWSAIWRICGNKTIV